jgi:hypothetical protein
MATSPLRAAQVIVVSGYALLLAGTVLETVATNYDFLEPTQLLIYRIAVSLSFVILGAAWWGYLRTAKPDPANLAIFCRSLWLFALASLVLATGNIAVVMFEVSPPGATFTIENTQGAVACGTATVVLGYLVVAAGFGMASLNVLRAHKIEEANSAVAID